MLTSQDPAALNNVILQMTDCIIEVPTIELTDDLKEEERLKVGSKEGICYSLTMITTGLFTFIQMTQCCITTTLLKATNLLGYTCIGSITPIKVMATSILTTMS